MQRTLRANFQPVLADDLACQGHPLVAFPEGAFSFASPYTKSPRGALAPEVVTEAGGSPGSGGFRATVR